MSDNLVSTMLRYLTPAVVEKLGAASGLETATADKAVTVIVPSLLSALAVLAARPAGAQQLGTAVAEHPIDTLGSLASSLPGSTLKAAMGTSVLSSLLGSDALGMVTSAVSWFTGIGEGSVRTLIGLLTPLIMGVLRREQRAAGLDANGLARMLARQTDQIAGAMPSGLRDLLDASGLYESIGLSTTPPRRTASRTPDRPSRQNMQRVVGDEATTARRLYWVLPLLVAGGLLWYLLANPPQTAKPVVTSGKLTYFTMVPENWSSIGGTLNNYVGRDVYNRAGENLGTVKDILIGPDGKMAAALISVGRFLGIGHKELAVPFTALQMEHGATNPRIVIDATKDVLQSAPTFERRPAPQPQVPK